MRGRLGLKMSDAQQQAYEFLVAQGTYIEAEVYKRKYPAIQYPFLIPVDNSAGEWTTSITFYSEDETGEAEWYNHLADDMPLADVTREQFTQNIHMAGIGYGYSLQELMVAQQRQINLDASRAASARQRYEEFVERKYMLGDTGKGWTGLINNTDVTRVDAIADGTGSSPLWSTKTADQINRDINDALTNVYIDSNTVEVADTLLLSPARWTALGNTRIPNTSITAMDFVMKNNAYTMLTQQPLTIRAVRGLETAGAGSVQRMMAYLKDPAVLKAHVPMRHRFLSPREKGTMSFIVPGIFRIGPMEIRRPGACRYVDNI